MKHFLILILVFAFYNTKAQIRTNNQATPVIGGESVFLDASALTFSNSSNLGKGLLFSRTDLTSFTFVNPNGGAGGFLTGYDGMIVYNTGTGLTPATNSGIGGQAVTPGFYYFDNPGNNFGNTTAGEWKPLGFNGSRTNVQTNTVNNTTTIINNVAEKVVILPGTANGTTTELVLDDSSLTNGPLAVTKLREAKIYDNTGVELLLIASGRYNTATNTLVTGDGMVNKLLPSGTYQVELYFE